MTHVLAIEVERDCASRDLGLRILIDGADLVTLVAQHEAPFAGDLAGKYGLLPAAAVLPPSKHFLGRAEVWYASGDGKPYLLLCDCGEPGCWPLEAEIELRSATVIWHRFRQPHRDQWSYESLGPFEFARTQYEAALDKAVSALRAADA